MKIIYTVTVFNVRGGFVKDQRTWGWFDSFEEARKCILENDGDIYEYGYYNIGLIETMPEGIVAKANETWFAIDFVDGKYNVSEAEKPGIFEHIVAFSMG